MRVQAHWQYLSRAIDRGGHLVDVRLSATRDQAAAEAFFRAFFRPQSQRHPSLTLGQRRALCQGRSVHLMGIMAAASPKADQLTNVP